MSLRANACRIAIAAVFCGAIRSAAAQATSADPTAKSVRPRITFADFEPTPDCDPRDAWLATAIEETLAWRLRRCGGCVTIPVVRAYQARAELAVGAAAPPAWVDAVRPLGATLLLSGRCKGPPEAVELTLTCTPLDGRESATFKPPPARLFETLNLATRWAVDISVGPGAAAIPPLALAPPSRSPSAVEYYARSIMALRSGDMRNAVQHARESFDFDSRFRPTIALLGQLELRAAPQRSRELAARVRLLAALAREVDDEHDRADAEMELGLVDVLGDARDAARVRFSSARAIFQSLGDVYGELGAMAQLIELELAETPSPTSAPATTASDGIRRAVALQAEILAAAEQMGDLLAVGPAANKLALLHERLGEWDTALAFHRRTIETAERAGSRPNQAAGWLFIGKWYRQQQRLDESVDALGRCVELVNPDARPMVRSLLAETLRARGDGATALAQYRIARDELGPESNLQAQLACLREIAGLEMQLGRRDAALVALQEARDIAGALRHPDIPAIDQQLAEWRAGQP